MCCFLVYIPLSFLLLFLVRDRLDWFATFTFSSSSSFLELHSDRVFCLKEGILNLKVLEMINNTISCVT
jgi:hypothetical protein